MTPMAMKDVFALPVGSQVFIRWKKDDTYPRLNEVCTISSKGDNAFCTGDGDYEWYTSEVPDMEDNLLDTGRGYAYFFYPPGNP